MPGGGTRSLPAVNYCSAMKILAVMVRYKVELSASQTAGGLSAALAGDPELGEAYRLLIWDNSPQPLANPRLPIPFEYRHSERNLGVSGAYNSAMAYALEQGAAWMLLLDQDSTITPEFLRAMLRHARELQADARVVAIVPTVKVRGITLSPKQYKFSRNCDYPAGQCGIAEGETVAINSGCMMRPTALEEVGGFSTDFWLDYSDIYVFHHFFKRGMRVWRAADVVLAHDMSIMDYDRLMTPWRYKNFSYAESAFHDLYRSRLERAVQMLRLLARTVKQRFKYRNPAFYRLTWEQLMYRIRVRREKRIARWHAEGRQRLENSGAQG